MFLINIDLAVIVGQQGPHISITSNYTHAHTLRHARARTHTQASINLIASSTHNAPEPWPTNYNSNLTLSINMGAILPSWTLVEWEMQINIVGHFLWSPLFPPLGLFSSPLVFFDSSSSFFFSLSSLSLSLSAPSSVSTFVSAVDSASITAKSNLSNLNLAGAPQPPCCCLFVWSPHKWDVW